MNEVVPYNHPVSSEGSSNEMSMKEKIGYTLLAGVGIGAIIHYSSKYIKNQRANNSDSKSFTEGSPQTIAKQMQMAFENDGYFGTDTKKLRSIMTRIRSKEEMAKVEKEYEKQYGKKLYRKMQDELQSSEYEEMLQIKEGKPEKAGQQVSGEVLYRTWAKRLKAGFDKMYGFVPGTDEDAVLTVLKEIPTQRSFVNVGVAYHKEFKANLMETMKSELSSAEYYQFMKMITDKPKA